MKSPQKSLKNWTKQNWRTKSGKPSSKTGERYLPEKAIKSLSPSEYAATTKAKREGTKAGKQFVNPMNAGMKALKKKAPAVAKKMGYSKGGMKKTMGYKAGGVVQAKCGASYKG